MRTAVSMQAARAVLVVWFALASGACHRSGPKYVRPSVATLEVVRGSVELDTRGTIDPIRGSARVPRDGTVRVRGDGRAILRLDSGAFALIDRNAELVAHLDGIEIRRGRVFVDGRRASATNVTSAHGSVTTEGAAVSFEVDANRTVAHCAAGEVTYRSPRGSDRLVQGEVLTLSPREPVVAPETLFEDWTGGLATPNRSRVGAPSFVGAIDARVSSALGSAGEPMSLRSHEIVARIVDDSARLEVVQTFFNGEGDTVEGEYRVRLPDGALVESFEIDRGTGFEPSIVAPLVEGTPRLPEVDGNGSARLAYDGPSVYRARLLAIRPGQTLRIRLVATSWLERRGGVRTLTIPLAGDSEPPLVGELSIRVDASGSGATSVAAGYGASVSGKVVTYRASDTKPRADFVVELGDRTPVATARAYEGRRTRERGRIERFARFDVPSDVLVDDVPSRASPLELLVVLDSSGGTEPEDLELARATLETLLAQLTSSDRIAVRLGDVTLHALDGAPENPATLDAAGRSRLLDAIARVSTGGATDLGTVLREASASLAGRANASVLYLGDAVPTDGAMSATGVAHELELVDDPPRLFALGLGGDANLGLLRAIFGDSSVVVRDRDEAARRVLETLASAGRPVIRDVTVELGPTVEQVFPTGPSVVPLGSSMALVARVSGELPSSMRVRGRFGSQRIDRSFPIEVREGVAADDVPRRWASHRLRLLLDEDAGREAIAELGLGFDLVTPWTPRIVGRSERVDLTPWIGVDVDPNGIAWSIGGATRAYSIEELGGARGFRAYSDAPIEPASEIEETWIPHDEVAATGGGGGDGGLGRASAARVLRNGTRGPRACFERKLSQRPDIAGEVLVRVSVDGAGRITTAQIARSTLGVADVDQCVLDEVRGLAFPATGGAVVTVEHVFVFQFATRPVSTSSRCSLASERDLDTRRRLWTERIAAASSSEVPIDAARRIYREARASCELDDWQARRALATALLGFLPGLDARVEFYRGFADDPILAPYLRESILRTLRTQEEVGIARRELGIDPSLDFGVFARAFTAAATPDSKLALVRRWLEVAPDDIDLRLRLLALLEETRALPEARRVARSLHVDPLVDARARTLVGEFWLRQNDRAEAVRVLSELVERGPLDPWARRRLGDLYLAYGFLDDAQREYATLALLRPADSTNLLLLARASAAASRIDEALRLEQRVSEEADDDVDEGLAAIARAFTTVRLARLRADVTDASLRPVLADRLRATGVLRRPPAVVVSLVWDHPDDRLVLEWLGPSAQPNEPWTASSTSSPELGISSFRILEREPGGYRIHVKRPDERDLRESRATLVITEGLGTPTERTTTRAITLTRDAREQTVEFGTGT